MKFELMNNMEIVTKLVLLDPIVIEKVKYLFIYKINKVLYNIIMFTTILEDIGRHWYYQNFCFLFLIMRKIGVLK